MNSFLKTLASRPLPWLDLNGPLTEVIISSRIRLARNLAGEIYPDTLDDSTGIDLMEKVFEACLSLPEEDRLNSFELNSLNEIEKDLLLERRLITHNSVFSVKAGVIVEEEEYFSILVNDEDHVHLQVIRPGLSFTKSWEYINRIDLRLNEVLKYDFCNDHGYLTASPTNIGTGLKASVLLDLSGLYMTSQIGGVVEAARVMGCRLEGADGTDGNTRPGRYVLSTVRSLGLKEEAMLASFEEFVEDVIESELRSRRALLADDPFCPLDYVGRAYGSLKYCWRLSETEAFDYLMTLRFGLQLGMFEHLHFEQIERALAYSGNAHLLGVLHEPLDSEDLDKARAGLVRKNIGLEI